MRNRVNIGTASIVLIFIILCLSVFSLLSLSDGKSALTFAQRKADSVTAYYEADSAGQAFLHRFFAAVSDGSSEEDALNQAAAGLPDGSETGFRTSGTPYCEIPMTAGQALCIEIDPAASAPAAYYVYNKEDYLIDDSLPVWGG